MRQFFIVNGDGSRTPTNCGYLDGYQFGDRLLEDVMFKLTVEDGVLKAEAAPNSVRYLNRIGIKRWLAAALIYAERADVFYSDEAGENHDVVLS